MPTDPTVPGRPSWWRRLQLPHLLSNYPGRPVWAVFVLLNGFFTVGSLALVAMLTGTPFVFPSLGPTAYLLFATPLHPASSPRNTLWGHAIGIACGYAALWACGLADHPAATAEGVHPARVLAAALSLAFTGALMVLFDVSHPPAGATTLIVSLGIIARPYHLLVVGLAVGVMTLQALAINRLAGLPYPLWSARPGETDAAGRPVAPEHSGNRR